MGSRKNRIFVGDFETTVFKGQDDTEVWASASVELFSEDVAIFHSISEQLDYFISLDSNIICYYHNLKFDGSFWLSHLLIDRGYKQALEKTGDGINDIRFLSPREMPEKSVIYSISNMGQWYRIILKINRHTIEFRDSLKLLPFSVKKIGDSFGTKRKKLEMEYKGFRYAGCTITPEEQHYIANDVLVVNEALGIMYEDGHNKLTIGSCCLSEYKNSIGRKLYDEYFPNIYDITIDEKMYGSKNAGEYVKLSYHGGWCYLVKGKEGKRFYNGTTADVNSLYSSMMSSESNNRYPIGLPTFWKGDYIPEEAQQFDKYYFVRIKTRFYLKNGKLPFIQIKSSLLYKATEMLESSDVFDKKTGQYYYKYIGFDGEIKDTRITLTMTMVDFKLFKEHYNLVDFEILDGCYFTSAIGIFDDYIEKYKKIKIESKGALREEAKLFLNNLYGKLASSPKSSFKVAYVRPDNVLSFYTVEQYDKVPGYIPCGSAITSYSRNFTIRAAQKNYHGPDKPGFIYADTDSIHCDLLPDELQGVKEHPVNFCCWKFETCWDVGYFTRQKTYIERVTHADRKLLEKPYYNVKCAGMPEKCKKLFIKSLTEPLDRNLLEGMGEDDVIKIGDDEYTRDDVDFASIKRELDDFNVGLRVPGKLLPKRIRGGVLLVDTTYEMR